MSDRQSGHGRKKNRLWILLIVVIVVLLGIVIAINQGGHEQEPSTEQTDENETVDDVQTAETMRKKQNLQRKRIQDWNFHISWMMTRFR